ncbi:beta-ketoacyl synthase N-terminal-like domain-containing protein [Bilophila wadsworthia]|uniref:beta-ketoacyl synthase N-terminal-like domain-containing protein n=1 Tax=Bilophila wadsworthia TaxID=35833 RepID=UPI003AB486CC
MTACATGTHSIGEAFHAIAGGYADAIIAGGAEAAINRLSIAGFSNGCDYVRTDVRTAPRTPACVDAGTGNRSAFDQPRGEPVLSFGFRTA